MMIWILTTLAFNAFSSVAPHPQALKNEIKKDILTIRKNDRVDFAQSIKQWQKRYGQQSIPLLFEISQEKPLSDQERAIALLAASKIAKQNPKNSEFKKLIKSKPLNYNEKSWLLRDTFLKVDSDWNPEIAYKKSLELMQTDPALVLRIKSAKNIGKYAAHQIITPLSDETVKKLIKVVKDPKNYRPYGLTKGRSDGVAEAALLSVRDLGNPIALKDLDYISKNARDPRVRAHALFAIKKIKSK